MASTTKYPSKKEIKELFDNLSKGYASTFFDRVSPNVDWIVMGTSQMSTRYTTLADFQEGTLKRLRHCFTDDLKFRVRNVVGGGDDEWCTVEMSALDTWRKNGKPYDMTYCWVCRFDEKGIIVQVRAYIDTALLQEVLFEHDSPVSKAPEQ